MFCGLVYCATFELEREALGLDKLGIAIERARAERQGLIGRVSEQDARLVLPTEDITPDRDSPDTNEQATSRVQGSRKTTRYLTPFEYTHTRVVPLNHKHCENNRIIAGRLGDERVEVYRQLRTQVLQTFVQHNWSTLAITSPSKNAGKTLTSINLAISLAQEVDQTVLLVDLDLTQPSVHKMLGVTCELGLADIIFGQANMQDVLFNPSIDRLTILPGRRLGGYSSELLTTLEMKNLFEDVAHRYESRIVIFDLPPVLRNDDALKFTPSADATLMVIEAGVNTQEEIDRSVHLLKSANLIGTILNKAKVRSSSV